MSGPSIIPEKCRKTLVCLREEGHDGRCQPANRAEQRQVRRILAAAQAPVSEEPT